MKYRELSEEDCIYIAGMLDAKAKFWLGRQHVVKHNHIAHQTFISFYSIDDGFMEIINKLFGSSIKYRLRVTETRELAKTRIDITVNFLPFLYRNVYRYMRNECKKALFNLIIEMRSTFCDDPKVHHRGNRISEENLRKREAIYERYLQYTKFMDKERQREGRERLQLKVGYVEKRKKMELTEKEKAERKGKCVTCGKKIVEGINKIRRHLDPYFINSDCRECLKKKEK